MKTRLHVFVVAASLLCAFVFAGCVQQDGVDLPTAPGPANSAAGPAALGQNRLVPGVVEGGDPLLVVTKSFGPGGGVIEAGRVSVKFPDGSFPPGTTRITLMVWGVGDAEYFTLEPRDLRPLKPAEFSFRLGTGKTDNLSYHWNDGGWREPMASWLNGDKTLLQSETQFLGEFVVAPKFGGKGRAGW